MAHLSRRRVSADYRIACICPMGVELTPMEAILDEIHDSLPTVRDQNVYTLGTVHGHNVVIAVMPETGNNTAATVATQLLNDFPYIRFGLLVGIGGGVPGEADVRLGDVVVSKPTKNFGGLVQYDVGKWLEGGRFERTGSLNKPPAVLNASVQKLRSQHQRIGQKLLQTISNILQSHPAMQAEYTFPVAERDQLFLSTYKHQAGTTTCAQCDDKQTVACKDRIGIEPEIHYGTIGSANTLVRDAALRDDLRQDMHILCVEMEAAGIMDNFPCLVVRGICDYADSHKNEKWQAYAALVAAAYTKDLLGQIPPKDVQTERQATVDTGAHAPNNNPNFFSTPSLLNSLVTVFVCVTLLAVLNLWHGAQSGNSGQQAISGIVTGGIVFNNGSKPLIDLKFTSPLGFHLDQAPYLDASSFVGRAAELEHMHQLLRPSRDPKGQQRLVLGGMGGMGKTQLALAYARKEKNNYDSVIWVDATSEATLKDSFRSVLGRIIDLRASNDLNNEQIITGMKKWLSEKDNTRWLLIFDGYDKPISYNLRSYYPHTSHGTVIVTTRLPSQVEGVRLDIKALDSIESSLQILQIRSQRENVSYERLDGLPLALATAGAFLRKTTLSFEQYLEAYEQRWQVDRRRPLPLQDYQDRTLYTTWDITYSQLTADDAEAAKMLKLLAYFDNQWLFYKLFQAGQSRHSPVILSDQIDFESLMGTLVDYCLVEVQHATQSYGIHSCVHDWTLGALNAQIDDALYWYAFDCVAASIDDINSDTLGQVRYSRLSGHAVRLTHHRFESCSELNSSERLRKATCIAQLLTEQTRLSPAEQMYTLALAGMEKALGPDHLWTLTTASNLGNLFTYQSKLKEAEQMYRRALAGKEKVLGPDHVSTLDTIHNLGNLCLNQRELAEAEQLYTRALAGREKTLGPEDASTISTVNNLGLLYTIQGRLVEAEQLSRRALAGYEKTQRLDHSSIFCTLHNLGALYAKQGKLVEAEQTYIRALAGLEEVYGLDHTLTLNAVYDLGLLYEDQGRLAEAEQLHTRALAGREKALGPEHTSTLTTIHHLALLYISQGRLIEAEQMYKQALAGREKAPQHTLTLDTVHKLGLLYTGQGKLAEAGQLYTRALAMFEKPLELDHITNLDTTHNLGLLYTDQGKLAEEVQIHTRALADREKVLKLDSSLILKIVDNLGKIGSLYHHQGKLADAEHIYMQALVWCEKFLDADNALTLTMVNNLGAIYYDQGRTVEAEQQFTQVLAGYTLDPDTFHNLGALYVDQGRLIEAEQIYHGVLAGCGKRHGPGPTTLLDVVQVLCNLGNLYYYQGMLAKAEQMYIQALAIREKALGLDHVLTLDAAHNLGNIYAGQERLMEAEQLYSRALVGYEKTLGPAHVSTLNAAKNLCRLHGSRRKLVEAE